MQGESEGPAGVSIYGQTSKGPEWWSKIKQFVAIMNGKSLRNVSLRDGTGPQPIDFYVGRISAIAVSIQFDDDGKKIKVLDGSAAMTTIDIQRAGDFPDGLFPNGITTIELTGAPKSKLTFSRLSLLTPPDGKYEEPKTPTPIPAPTLVPTSAPTPVRPTATAVAKYRFGSYAVFTGKFDDGDGTVVFAALPDGKAYFTSQRASPTCDTGSAAFSIYGVGQYGTNSFNISAMLKTVSGELLTDTSIKGTISGTAFRGCPGGKFTFVATKAGEGRQALLNAITPYLKYWRRTGNETAEDILKAQLDVNALP